MSKANPDQMHFALCEKKSERMCDGIAEVYAGTWTEWAVRTAQRALAFEIRMTARDNIKRLTGEALKDREREMFGITSSEYFQNGPWVTDTYNIEAHSDKWAERYQEVT